MTADHVNVLSIFAPYQDLGIVRECPEPHVLITRNAGNPCADRDEVVASSELQRMQLAERLCGYGAN
jgi:hypothetical protein